MKVKAAYGLLKMRDFQMSALQLSLATFPPLPAGSRLISCKQGADLRGAFLFNLAEQISLPCRDHIKKPNFCCLNELFPNFS